MQEAIRQFWSAWRPSGDPLHARQTMPRTQMAANPGRVGGQRIVETQNRAELKRLEARLAQYERQFVMRSEDFYRRFRGGELGDEMDLVE